MKYTSESLEQKGIACGAVTAIHHHRDEKHRQCIKALEGGRAFVNLQQLIIRPPHSVSTEFRGWCFIWGWPWTPDEVEEATWRTSSFKLRISKTEGIWRDPVRLPPVHLLSLVFGFRSPSWTWKSNTRPLKDQINPLIHSILLTYTHTSIHIHTLVSTHTHTQA